ncbi:MAG TPA: hypothetical protein ENN07_05745, partial [candidate division Zixibacteria bacterium]|nr:hypothetical protein [candidate division Zixibacteria bacterium]
WDRFGQYYLTAELTVRFKKPIEAGKTYRVRARMTESRSRVYFAEGEILSPEGGVFAKAIGKFFVMKDVPSVRK